MLTNCTVALCMLIALAFHASALLEDKTQATSFEDGADDTEVQESSEVSLEDDDVEQQKSSDGLDVDPDYLIRHLGQEFPPPVYAKKADPESENDTNSEEPEFYDYGYPNYDYDEVDAEPTRLTDDEVTENSRQRRSNDNYDGSLSRYSQLKLNSLTSDQTNQHYNILRHPYQPITNKYLNLDRKVGLRRLPSYISVLDSSSKTSETYQPEQQTLSQISNTKNPYYASTKTIDVHSKAADVAKLAHLLRFLSQRGRFVHRRQPGRNLQIKVVGGISTVGAGRNLYRRQRYQKLLQSLNRLNGANGKGSVAANQGDKSVLNILRPLVRFVAMDKTSPRDLWGSFMQTVNSKGAESSRKAYGTLVTQINAEHERQVELHEKLRRLQELVGERKCTEK